jgi:hypothetical protein
LAVAAEDLRPARCGQCLASSLSYLNEIEMHG